MNYCSIQEAWGKNDYISSQYKKFTNPNHDRGIINSHEKNFSTSKKTLENFSPNENKLKNHISKINNCDDFVKHLNKCRKCQNAIRNKYRPKILENFTDIIETNKDILVLILIGISIMLFFNLINSIN